MEARAEGSRGLGEAHGKQATRLAPVVPGMSMGASTNVVHDPADQIDR